MSDRLSGEALTAVDLHLALQHFTEWRQRLEGRAPDDHDAAAFAYGLSLLADQGVLLTVSERDRLVQGYRVGPTWQPIETAPRVTMLSGGRDLLLGWVAPGIGEWIQVVGVWNGEQWTDGTHKAYPTHWMYAPDPPGPNADQPQERLTRPPLDEKAQAVFIEGWKAGYHDADYRTASASALKAWEVFVRTMEQR